MTESYFWQVNQTGISPPAWQAVLLIGPDRLNLRRFSKSPRYEDKADAMNWLMDNDPTWRRDEFIWLR